MNPKKILILSLLAILLCSILTGGAAARYTTPEGMNAGISPGNTIYIGEGNLNFSALGTAGKTITGLVRFDGDTPQNKISIANDIGSVPGNTPTGYYCVEYDNTPQKGTSSVWVDQFLPGTISVIAADNPSGTPLTGTNIPKDLGVIFYMTSQGIKYSELVNWYDYEISMPSGLKRSSVKNLNGAMVSLNIHADPSQKYQDLAFRFSDQEFVPVINPGEELSGVSVTFKITNMGNLNGQYSPRPVVLTSVKPAISLDTSKIETDKVVTVTLSGTAATEYPLVITPSGDNRPYFVDDGKITVINNQSITVTTDDSGKYVVSIRIPDNVITGEYTVSTIYSVSATFTVAKPPVVTLYFDEPSADVLAGKFAVGDQIYLTGRVSGLDTCPVYLYITRPEPSGEWCLFGISESGSC